MIDVFEKLSIPTPIIEGGMTLIGDGHLAATISAAGALGVIGTGKYNYDQAKKQVEIAMSETSKPIGLNIMLENKHVSDIIRLVEEYKIPFVTLGGGDPAPYIQQLINADTLVYPVVPSVAIAKRMQRIGASGVIAEGMESGGHIGSLTTLALVPQVIRNVTIPVIAAGGIATGDSILACLSLGAVGVQIGTAFAVTNESPASQAFKDKVLTSRDIDTVITGSTVGASVRSIRNKYTKDFISAELNKQRNPTISNMEVKILAKGSLKKAALDGDVVNGSIMAGQIAGILNDQESVAETIQRLKQELLQSNEDLLTRIGRWVIANENSISI